MLILNSHFDFAYGKTRKKLFNYLKLNLAKSIGLSFKKEKLIEFLSSYGSTKYRLEKPRAC